MARQSISLTTPNDKWLKSQVGSGKEFTSKSEIVNDLIRKARADQENEAIRRHLIRAEQGGFVPADRHAILAEFKDTVGNG